MSQRRFRQAVQLLTQKQYGECLRLCRELRNQPEPVPVGNLDLDLLYGIALCESGDINNGSTLLDALIAAQPDHPEIHYNYASVMAACGQTDKAIDLYQRTLELAPQHLSALNNLGNSLLQSGRMEDARQTYERLIEIEPAHVQALFNLGNLALRNDELGQARNWLSRALKLKPDYDMARLAMASIHNTDGAYRQALDMLRVSSPRLLQDDAYYRERSIACTGAGNFTQALDDARTACDLNPDMAANFNNLGVTESGVGHLDESIAAFEKAIELDPAYDEARGNLIDLCELSNRLDEGRAILDSLSDEQSARPEFQLARARYEIRDSQWETGNNRLLQLLQEDLPERMRRDAHYLAGRSFDKLKQHDDAFNSYIIANQTDADLFRRDEQPADRFIEITEQLAEHWTRPLPRIITDKSRTEAASSGEYKLAFLFGFQRSGTTLLDTMLGSDERIQVMEELPALNLLIRDMEQAGLSMPACLYSLDAERVESLREAYFSHAAQCLSDATGETLDSDCLLLDKSPLNIVYTPLIRALFPEARLILALRHPCDVVLSCFMQDFTMTPFMLNYTSVQGVTDMYRRVMALWLQYLDVFELEHHAIRYEDLLADKTAELARLKSFLGLEDQGEDDDHTRHAHERGLINTPSYYQVTQPLYTSARYRWLNYRRHLKESMPVLQPFIERFGYAGVEEAESD